MDKVAYLEALANLDPVTRAQLENGDWDVLPKGNLFRAEWFDLVGRVDEFPADQVRFWDMAATEQKAGTDPDWTVGLHGILGRSGTIYLTDRRKFRKEPDGAEAEIRLAGLADGVRTIYAFEQEPGSAGKIVLDHYRKNVLPDHTVIGVPATGSKITRAQVPSALASQKQIKIVKGEWVPDFLKNLEPFPCPGIHDDDVDALSGLLAVLNERRGAQPYFRSGVDVSPT